MIEFEDVKDFLGDFVGVVYTDSGRDFILKGKFVKISSSAVTLYNSKFGRAVVSLDSIKKIFEINGVEHA